MSPKEISSTGEQYLKSPHGHSSIIYNPELGNLGWRAAHPPRRVLIISPPTMRKTIRGSILSNIHIISLINILIRDSFDLAT